MTKSTKAYKAFDKGMTCRGFQYEEGKTYTHNGDVSLCNEGFHACKNPFDVLDFYDLTASEFGEVEMSGEVKSDEKKTVSSKIEIKAKLNLTGFIKAAIDFTWSKCKCEEEGHYAKLAASGGCAKLAASGDSAKLAASGDSAQLACDGKDSVAISCSVNGRVKGVHGTLVALTWFVDGKPKDIIKGRIGYGKLKKDTWYTLDAEGKFTEFD